VSHSELYPPPDRCIIWNPGGAVPRTEQLGLISILIAIAALPTADAGERPSIILITVDTLRTDRLSAYGYGRPTSPHIDRLLERGLVFERARTIEPLTNPALASMVTGIDPHQHGATRNGLRIEQGLDSLPKILERTGWDTAAFVSNWTLKDNVSRLGEHFQLYEGVFTRRRWFGLINSEATAEDVTEAAVEWAEGQLRQRPGRPFLLWVHYVEPHAPYRFHSEFAERLGIDPRDPPPSDRYDTEIAAVDLQIGRLVDWLEARIVADNLLMFFAGDHGESLGEPGYWGHGRYLYEPSLSIPMGLVWQGRITPGRVTAPAVIHDVAPTVLELLGVEVPEQFTGFSWAAVIDGAEPPSDRGLCYQAHKGAVHGARESDRARSKGLLSVGYVIDERKEILRIKNNSHSLFDLLTDPGELDNLTTEDTAPTSELLRCLAQISDGLGALDRVATRKLDPEDVERLRALGYLE
jgi:arylsulfatase A-like enzyme